MSSDLPIACELSGPEQRDRERVIRAIFHDMAGSVTERPDGIRVRFPAGSPCLPAIAELMTFERACCRFLRFELAAEPDQGPVELTITGPEGTREFLRDWWAGEG